MRGRGFLRFHRKQTAGEVAKKNSVTFEGLRIIKTIRMHGGRRDVITCSLLQSEAKDMLTFGTLALTDVAKAQP
jgi:hypothetical protein